jgi:hypothetical protein
MSKGEIICRLQKAEVKVNVSIRGDAIRIAAALQ